MRILVTGGKGQLGRALMKLTEGASLHEFIFVDIEELDLSDTPKVLQYMEGCHPEIIINCAAYTAVDKAEQEKAMAMKLNAEVPGLLAGICEKSGATLIHISTDYIFNGRNSMPYVESDQPDPLSVYAMSKYLGEVEILKHNASGLILRTSWLYSEYGINFVRTIFNKAKETKELRVVYDQVGSPTYAGDLAGTILQVLPLIRDKHSMEIYHYSNEGIASWYDFAQAIVELSGFDCNIIPIETSELKQSAVRPHYSVMSKSKIKKHFGPAIPYWRVSLEKCLELLVNK